MRSKNVVETTAEDTEDSESGVQSRIGIIGDVVIYLTTPAHAGEGIEHPWTTETHQSDETYLHKRRVIPELCPRPTIHHSIHRRYLIGEKIRIAP